MAMKWMMVREVCDMASVFKYGKMERSTRANGRIIKLTGREPSGTQMVTSTRVNGKKTKPTVMESTRT